MWRGGAVHNLEGWKVLLSIKKERKERRKKGRSVRGRREEWREEQEESSHKNPNISIIKHSLKSQNANDNL